MTRMDMTHVAYAGSPAAMRGILGGEAEISFTSLVSSLAHVRSGKLRALAVTSLERAPVLPDVPTLDESGVKQFEVSGWQAVLAPAGTSIAIRAKLQRAISEILNAPDVSARMAAQGLTIVASPPAQFGEYLASEVSKWGELIRRLRLNTAR
jgi:tripartite-type tricarboxylate transporter receptor subunit TctC